MGFEGDEAGPWGGRLHDPHHWHTVGPALALLVTTPEQPVWLTVVPQAALIALLAPSHSAQVQPGLSQSSLPRHALWCKTPPLAPHLPSLKSVLLQPPACPTERSRREGDGVPPTPGIHMPIPSRSLLHARPQATSQVLLKGEAVEVSPLALWDWLTYL